MKFIGLFVFCILALPSLVMATTTTTIQLHDLTNMTNSDTFIGVMNWANDVGPFWLATILLVWIIIFGTLAATRPAIDSMITALVVSNVYTILIASIGFVPVGTVMMPLLLLAFVIIIRYASPPS